MQQQQSGLVVAVVLETGYAGASSHPRRDMLGCLASKYKAVQPQLSRATCACHTSTDTLPPTDTITVSPYCGQVAANGGGRRHNERCDQQPVPLHCCMPPRQPLVTKTLRVVKVVSSVVKWQRTGAGTDGNMDKQEAGGWVVGSWRTQRVRE